MKTELKNLDSNDYPSREYTKGENPLAWKCHTSHWDDDIVYSDSKKSVKVLGN